METFEDIKQEIENYLRDGVAFDFILKKNPQLYQNKLDLLFKNDMEYIQNNNTSFYFKCDPSFVKLIDKPFIYYIYKVGKSEDYEYLYISDFEYNGFICKDEDCVIGFKIEATIRIFTNKSLQKTLRSWEIQVEPKIINVLDKNAIEVWERNEKAFKISELENLLGIRIELL